MARSHHDWALKQLATAPPHERPRWLTVFLMVRSKHETSIVVEAGSAEPTFNTMRVRLNCRKCSYERVVKVQRFLEETQRAIELKRTRYSFD